MLSLGILKMCSGRVCIVFAKIHCERFRAFDCFPFHYFEFVAFVPQSQIYMVYVFSGETLWELQPTLWAASAKFLAVANPCCSSLTVTNVYDSFLIRSWLNSMQQFTFSIIKVLFSRSKRQSTCLVGCRRIECACGCLGSCCHFRWVATRFLQF